MEDCDVVYVCLYPMDTVQYLLDNEFKPGAVLTDVCGVKRFIVEKVSGPLKKKGLLFCGGHPMAGSEGSGFKDSDAELFRGAHYILMKDADQRASGLLSRLAQEIGFAGITKSTPDEHDSIIAYTSQLAHVISAAYVRTLLPKQKASPRAALRI
jgi:prephenate dehydrogenase